MSPPTDRELAAMRVYLEGLAAFVVEAGPHLRGLGGEALVRAYNAYRIELRNGTLNLTGADPPSPGPAPTGGPGDGKGGGANAASSEAMRSTPTPPPQAPSPPGKCPEHGKPWVRVPAGVSRRTGAKYAAFWACPVMGCKKRPPKEAPR